MRRRSRQFFFYQFYGSLLIAFYLNTTGGRGQGCSSQAIKVPIQLWASELGGDGVTPHMVAAVDSGLPVKHEYHVVPKAGHFAFLAPCPPPLAKARPELCTDAPGFDRGAFHHQFDADVLAFFRARFGDRLNPVSAPTPHVAGRADSSVRSSAMSPART